MAFRLFIAGPWADREQVQVVGRTLTEAGYIITSRWLSEHTDIPDDTPDREELLLKQAMDDIEDVANADGFVYCNFRMSEGKATELGLALAWGKPILLIGPRTCNGPGTGNIYLKMPFAQVDNVDEAVVYLNEQLRLAKAAMLEGEHAAVQN